MVSLDPEFNCRSCQRHIFHGSDTISFKLEKLVITSAATVLEKLFREISYYEKTPPKLIISCLPLESRLHLVVFYPLLIHGTLVKFWATRRFRNFFFHKYHFSSIFVYFWAGGHAVRYSTIVCIFLSGASFSNSSLESFSISKQKWKNNQFMSYSKWQK